MSDEKCFSEQLINSSIDGIVAFDQECCYTAWNSAMERITGISKSEVLGKCAFEVFPSLKESGAENDFIDTLNGRSIIAKNQRYVLPKTGQELFFDTYYSPLYSQFGEIVGGLVIARDISERRQAEEKLKHYQILCEHTCDIILFIRNDCQIIEANNAAIKAYGYSREELLSLKIQNLQVSQPRELLIEQMLQAERESILFETIQRRKDGSTFPIEVSWQSTVVGNERVLLSIIRDITDRKQAEAALQQANQELNLRVQARTDELTNVNEQLQTEINKRQRTNKVLEKKEEQYRLIVETTTEGILVLNSEGKTTFVNSQMAEILGYTVDEMLGMPVFAFISEDEQANAAVKIERCRQGIQEQQDLKFSRKDGSQLWAILSITPIFDEVNQYAGALAMVTNITQRKQVEEALQESEEKFRTIVENAHEIIYLLKPDGIFSYVSPKWSNFLGHDIKDVEGKSLALFLHPDDLQNCIDFLNKVLKTGEKQEGVEYQIKHKDGTWRWHTSNVSALKDQSGNVLYYVGICRDITERKRTEEKLRLNEERFRQLADNIHEVFWISDLDSNQMLYVSPAYEAIWGYTCALLYEQPRLWLDSVYPEDREHVTAAFKKQIQGHYNYEYRIIRSDRSIRWIWTRAFPVRNALGEVYRIAGISEDITERKQRDEEIRFLHTMTQAIFESEDFSSALRIALHKVCEATGWNFGEAWIPRPDGTALEYSPAWYSSTHSLQEFRKLSEGFVFPPNVGLPGRVWVSKKPEWHRDVSQESNTTYVRAQIAMESGLKAALGIPLIANERVLAVLVFYMFESREEDERLIELISASTELGLIIQRKQAEEEVCKALEQEKQLNELKSRFISMTSHEFRTPLSTILFSAELLENYGQKWSEEKKSEHLQRIQISVERMTQLLEDILLLGKAEAGKLEYKAEKLNLDKFCSDLVEELQLGIGNKHAITFIKQGQCTTTCMDEKLLRQILSNLLSNAIKYSPKGSTVGFEASCQNGEVIFQIRDQGIGIPLEDQQRLFESFHRANNVGTIPGTGLGLAIVKKSVDLHGGQITVDSKVGVGTTFTVRLPLND